MTDFNEFVLNAFRERSTIDCMNAPNPPPIPKGKQNYRFKVGKTYTTTGMGTIKKGIQVTITERYKQNGFCYYRDQNNHVHHQQDLE